MPAITAIKDVTDRTATDAQGTFKTLSGTAAVKDVDITGRTVTGYFSAFGNEDDDGDIIAKGAYHSTIKQMGPVGSNRFWHLDQHDPARRIAKPKMLKEDSRGLYFETVFPDTTLASDLLKLYDAGHINEHSVFIDQIQRKSSDERVITSVRAWEGSTVTWGANSETPAMGVKSFRRVGLSSEEAARAGVSEDLLKRMEAMEARLKQLEGKEEERKEITLEDALSIFA